MKRIHPADYMAQRPDRTHIGHFVSFRPNVLPDELCDELVSLYDSNPEKHVERVQGDHLRFMQLNVTENAMADESSLFYALHSHVVNFTLEAIAQYFADVNGAEGGAIPASYGFEHFRINRTANNGKDGFGPHVDVGDHESARRFVTALYYLNDISEGGDAAFPNLGFSCQPVKGSMLIFPSSWQFLHLGLKPVSDPKYIMTTFCHYL